MPHMRHGANGDLLYISFILTLAIELRHGAIGDSLKHFHFDIYH